MSVSVHAGDSAEWVVSVSVRAGDGADRVVSVSGVLVTVQIMLCQSVCVLVTVQNGL